MKERTRIAYKNCMTDLSSRAASGTIILNLPDAAATEALGALLARHVAAGDVIALWGDLGAGKTCLARALIQTRMRAENALEDVPSPTFTLVQTYDLRELPVWHVDLYRLSAPEEADELGLEEAAAGLLLLEWPDRLEDELPETRLDVCLEEKGEGRIARLTLKGEPWEERRGVFERGLEDE